MRSASTRLARRRKSAPPVSRINRRRTKVNALEQLLEDSDEGSFSSTSSGSSESGLSYQESEDDSQNSDSAQPPSRKKVGNEDGETDEEKCAVSRRMRKRSACILDDNDDTSCSSDSDVGTEPVRKVKQNKRLKFSDSEDEANTAKEREAEVKKAAAKRSERKSKLIELLKKRKKPTTRRRRRTEGSDNEAEVVEENEDKEEAKSSKSSSEEDTYNLMDSSEEEKQADSDSLKDFIVEDEEQKEGDEEEGSSETQDKNFLSHLPRQFITGSQFTHFQVVVKALLINALDTSFLQSLYNGERTKRYAQEMKLSLHHFEERLVLPRLENLMQRSRWKDRYKERVECYPKVRITMVNILSKSCEACELHRHGRFCVRLSGQLYDNQTLQEDQFMPNDFQSFFAGSVCAKRTQVYHALKHYKYHLFNRCGTALKEQKDVELETLEGNDEPVKDTVNRVFIKLEEKGWITKQYEEFEEFLNDADYFQEERLD
ncbi:coiled-coil domain-containing protein 82 [Trichomycterus rosablanca]|uniref:coiled-coil domain-containing protein 82 n=1 Tax=Trichomycterus rosablanca TaxID=2290929 RepID=UPI002F35C072